MIKLIVRRGKPVAAALPLMFFGGFVAIFVAYHLPVWTVLAAGAAAMILYGLLRSYVEIVQVISETLLPR